MARETDATSVAEIILPIQQVNSQRRRSLVQYAKDAFSGARNPRSISIIADTETQPKGTFPEFLSATFRKTFFEVISRN